jgi:hypothetical protein
MSLLAFSLSSRSNADEQYTVSRDHFRTLEVAVSYKIECRLFEVKALRFVGEIQQKTVFFRSI